MKEGTSGWKNGLSFERAYAYEPARGEQNADHLYRMIVTRQKDLAVECAVYGRTDRTVWMNAYTALHEKGIMPTDAYDAAMARLADLTTNVPSSVVLPEDLPDEATCPRCGETWPADAEHFFLHRASGGLHLRSHCRRCEPGYRTELAQRRAATKRTSRLAERPVRAAGRFAPTD